MKERCNLKHYKNKKPINRRRNNNINNNLIRNMNKTIRMNYLSNRELKNQKEISSTMS